ncbi:MAG: cation:proton antiporter, partial [Candidatus Eremiobacteraeota bacterium]|nr:cation:proton antiporter [Candidatus Eremiobacteraeota bacterium]
TAVALSTTAVGTLLPLLRDQGWLKEPYGPAVLAAGSAGEALPLVVLSLILAGRQEAPWQAFLLVLFAALAGGLIAVAGRIGKSSFGRLVERTMHLSGQLPLRLVLLLLIAMVLLSEELNVDLVLAAFVSGAACRHALPKELHESLQVKLDSIGYGLLIPIFFVVSGIRLDLVTLVKTPSCLLMVPVLLGIMLLARGLPALVIYRDLLDLTQRKALALHCSTQLPLVVAISSIGVRRDIIPTDQAAAMVGAAVLSLIVFPILAARYRPSSE